jgi:hypothetical protein
MNLNLTPDQLVDPQTLNTEQFCWLLGQISILRAWATAVESEALVRILNGQDLPGWKVVEGRPGNRKWDGEEDIILHRLQKKLRLDYEDIAPRILISPAIVEKLLKSQRRGKDMGMIADLIIRPKGRPAIVPETDPRSPYVKGSEFSQTDEEDYP